MKKEIMKVGFPLNESAASSESYATLKYHGIEIQIGQTGLDSIIPALKRAISDEVGSTSMSTFHVKDLALSLEKIQDLMRSAK